MPATSAAVAALQSQEGGNSLTYRELNTVLWATCLLVVFIPLVVGLWRLIRYGIEEQNRDELHSSTAPRAADQPTHPTTHEAAVGERS